MIIKSQEALDWLELQERAISEEKRLGLGNNKEPIRLTAFVFYKDNRPDLSIELVLDALEKTGVISNDRYVFEFRALKVFSKTVQGIYCIIQALPKGLNRDYGKEQLSRWVGIGDQELDWIFQEAFQEESEK